MTVKIPGYKILGTLGKGGMATVYLAEHEIFQRKVALKVMAQALADDPSFGERFMREARIVSQLVHPNIVTVYDVGVHEGHYYLSMEFIDGKDLKHARKHLSLERKVHIILDIAKALEYAGNKGYVHRDIKPENIMLYAEDCRAVLTDFGIARAAEAELSFTQTGTAIGTPHYMSPEQAKGQPVDIRSDIYGLGVVFYLLLVGCVPYDAESAVAIGIKHITDPIPELPEGLEALQPIIDKMLAKLPEERYQRPAELVTGLSKISLPTLVAALDEASARAAESFESASDDAPTVIARATVRGGADSPSLLYSGDSADADDPTPVLGHEAVTLDEQGAPILPWLAGLAVLLIVVAAVLYSQNPDRIHSWFEANGEPVPTVSAPDPVDEPPPETADRSAVRAEGDQEPQASQQTVPGEQSTPAETVENPPVETVQEQLAQTDAEDLRRRIETLRAEVETDPSQLRSLVDALRQLKDVAPDTDIAEIEAELVAEEVNRIQQQIEAGQIEAAKSRLNELRRLPIEGLTQVVAGVEEDLAQQEQIEQWLREAEQFLASDTLTRPADSNARARFTKVLAVDPGNRRAKEGLARVSDRLAALAAEALQAGRVDVANDYVAKALEVNPNSDRAAAVREQLNQQEGQERLQKLLAQGDAQLREGQYFTPKNENAFHYFSRALKLQPNSDAARNGIERTIDAFEERLFNLLTQDHIDAVRELVRTAHQLLPNDERLAAVELRVEEAIAEKVLAQQPRVASIAVVGGGGNKFVQEQPETIRAERTISVSFRYENFESATSVIQAILLDGTRSMQIAQVPVVVTGSEGTKTFRIDRPVDGFPAGRYTVDLMVQGTRLATQSFRVE
jgi:serine/threonine-protein kinase PpkA